MIGLFILIAILMFFITILMYLVILGSNINKSDFEKQIDYEEEEKYIQNHENEKLMKKLNRKKFKLGKK